MRGVRVALATLAVVVAVPAPAYLSTPITTAQPQLALMPLVLVTATGKHRYQVELAATADQQEIGLMFRRKMAPDRGMLFPFDPPRTVNFWMENTILPLDLVFVAPDRTVLNIAAHAKPYSRDIIGSTGTAAAVLELNAGEAARIGLRPGDKVDYKLPR
jgi:uncharacterized membrane protein (UPF0127 family)